MAEKIRLHAYNGRTGQFKKVLPFSSLTWSDALNEDGDLSATIVGKGIDPTKDIQPYGTILAAVQGDRIFHAGYIKEHSYSVEDDTYSITAGGCLAVLDKRLVLNRALNGDGYWNGRVVIDEENPAGEWILYANGSYSDLIRALIEETKVQAGELPIQTTAYQGGSHERSWKCWELATVATRIQDIGDLEDGDEFRFDPVIENGYIRFVQRTAHEIVDNTWHFVADAQGAHVEMADRNTDGSNLCAQCYATGGKDEDWLLTARANGSLGDDYPVLQIADTSHGSVSELWTLQSYAAAAVSLGSRLPQTTGLQVPIAYRCMVGDHVDLGFKGKLYAYKLTDISGSADDGLLTLSLQERV